MGVRAPVVVGRDHEIGIIERALGEVAKGRGQVVLLTGEAGIGKSRLAAHATDLAYGAELSIMRGRGSAVGRTVPFRALSEALLSLQRLGTHVDVEQLGAYRPELARLNPDWGTPSEVAASGSLMVLAEGVLRLTELVGRHAGCAVVLDDLQYVDPDTLAVLEYVIDNIEHQPTLLLCTIRDDDADTVEFARTAGRRSAATVVPLRRLSPGDVTTLGAVCLGGAGQSLPSAATDLLWTGSMGLPFLVEELLDEIVTEGRLVRDEDGWRMVDSFPAPPSAFVEGIDARLGRLSAQAREFVSVAAVLGQRFPLVIVQEVTGFEYRTLLRHLHGDVVANMVAPDDHTPDWYLFTHALVVDAVLALLAEETRVDLARRAADAVEKLNSDVPGDWCHLCARLREAAGQFAEAGQLYARAGRRALAQGAAQSAVTLLDRSLDLLVHDPANRASALESQLLALTEAGQVDRALAVGARFDEFGSGLDRIHRVRLHTQLAWAANLAGRTEGGLDQVRIARALLGPDPDDEHVAPIDVVAAHLELDRATPGRLEVAEAMALRAATVAERIPLPIIACQAWQLLGALARRHDPARATAYLEKSRVFAIAHDLPIWEIHALVRLGLDDALRAGDIDRLEQARELASRIGAVIARYQSEVNISLQLILRGEFTAARNLIDNVSAAAARLGLLEIRQFMLVARAVLAGHQCDRAELESAQRELAGQGGDQTQYVPRLHGLGAAFCSLLQEDREQANADLATALATEEANPTTFHLSGRHGLALLLRALDGTLDWAEYVEVSASPAAGMRWDRHFALLAAAVLTGRRGDPEQALAWLERGQEAGELYPVARHLGLRLVGEAAAQDGWGEPDRWLRTAEQYFHDAGIRAVPGACRALLRRMGVRVTQRRSGTKDVPDDLRAVGVTGREYEVLLLLGARLANNEIAVRLHLSRRTVEKHVSSLMAKTGATNRVQLGKLTAGDAR